MGALLDRFAQAGVTFATAERGQLRVVGKLSDDTRAAIRANKSAILDELAANGSGLATPEQQRELERLIARILPHDTQAERDWTLSIAVRDPENALTSFRALAARSRYGHE